MQLVARRAAVENIFAIRAVEGVLAKSTAQCVCIGASVDLIVLIRSLRKTADACQHFNAINDGCCPAQGV